MGTKMESANLISELHNVLDGMRGQEEKKFHLWECGYELESKLLALGFEANVDMIYGTDRGIFDPPFEFILHVKRTKSTIVQ